MKEKRIIEKHNVEIFTDGLFCQHSMPCPIYNDEHAVLNMNTGIFHPSWKARQEGC